MTDELHDITHQELEELEFNTGVDYNAHLNLSKELLSDEDKIILFKYRLIFYVKLAFLISNFKLRKRKLENILDIKFKNDIKAERDLNAQIKARQEKRLLPKNQSASYLTKYYPEQYNKSKVCLGVKPSNSDNITFCKCVDMFEYATELNVYTRCAKCSKQKCWDRTEYCTTFKIDLRGLT